VPAMGESVTEATIAKWLKKAGDFVAADQPIAELETDKVTIEVLAPIAGALQDIQAKTGQTVKVGTILGYVDERQQRPVPSGVSPKAPVGVAEAVKLNSSSQSKVEELQSPAVRKLLQENNLNPEQIQGTGKDHRLTKGDVIEAVKSQPTQTNKMFSNPVSEGKTNNLGRVEEKIPMSRLRRRIAERLKIAQNTAAMLTTFNEVDLLEVNNFRNKYKEVFEKKHGVKLGYMSFFVKACTQALQEMPMINAEIRDDDIVYKKYYDIGVAVGTEQGLVVPVVRDADQLSFSEIEKRIAELGKKARDGKLSLDELTGGTFTITNGGVYGSLLSTPILNPPQSAILGMHKIQMRPVVVQDKIEIRPMMYLALSYDHRLIDGKEAVGFLVRVKEFLEEPQRLLFNI
ncbi:MAG TPA: 2-oxoglutarate dehydrogenase complex dihydrolipoyllysine-residue succinyltransferase, partial [Alphaproteobacteria bacterium]|nr:2-oxoglutarate dehydrogenase complex dihydrolipoyllysine-residue succinyltransferase [Alphaproteobacteria bacterium]